VKFGQLHRSCPATVVLQYQYCNTPATVLLLQVSATMPRGFKKIKLSGPMKAIRMRDDDPPLHQRQVANSEHGDEAEHDDTPPRGASRSIAMRESTRTGDPRHRQIHATYCNYLRRIASVMCGAFPGYIRSPVFGSLLRVPSVRRLSEPGNSTFL
jgi:hypothetical protein